MSTDGMKVRAIAPWFGGKRTLAPLIVDLLGKHTQYFEPFCGSMAVLFAKEPSQKETVNDLHGDLINLALCLQSADAAEWLYGELSRVLFCEDILRLSVQWLQANPLLLKPGQRLHWLRAYHYFIASWMMRNGVAGTQRQEFQVAVRWTKNGGSPTVRWKHALSSIPAWHQRLSNIVILNRNAFDILDRFEDVEGTAFCVDPPYFSDTRSGFGKHGAGSKYLHEFDHSMELFGDDHERLARILNGYKRARIVVCYYDHPKIRTLYQGWRFVDCSRVKNLGLSGATGERPVAPEVLIVNDAGRSP